MLFNLCLVRLFLYFSLLSLFLRVCKIIVFGSMRRRRSIGVLLLRLMIFLRVSMIRHRIWRLRLMIFLRMSMFWHRIWLLRLMIFLRMSMIWHRSTSWIDLSSELFDTLNFLSFFLPFFHLLSWKHSLTEDNIFLSYFFLFRINNTQIDSFEVKIVKFSFENTHKIFDQASRALIPTF